MKNKKLSYFEDLNTGGNNPIIENGEPFFFERGKVGCLLCHGYTGTPNEMKGIGTYLADNDITVLGPLLPGHGTVVKEMKKTTMDDYFNEYNNAYKKLKNYCDEIFICGHSLGGVLSLKFASENKIHGIISMAAPIKFKRLEGFFLATIGPLLKNITIKKSRKELIEQKHYKIICYDRYPVGPAISIRKTIHKTRKKLSNIKSPILIIQGQLDSKWIVDSSRIIFKEVKSENKNIIILQKTSHVLTLGPEKKKIHNFILEFIQKNSKLLNK
ncbi:MAG: alpha/beta hydrolase [Asgard group archaeon]|nr:alpha/beta hydrolase [Asgard group archaeon]